MSGAGKSAAVIIGASGGIGGALEAALIEEGLFDLVHGFARSRNGAYHLDLLDEASIAAAAAYVAHGPAPSLVIVATGLLHRGDQQPEKALSDLDPDWLAPHCRARSRTMFPRVNSPIQSVPRCNCWT